MIKAGCEGLSDSRLSDGDSALGSLVADGSDVSFNPLLSHADNKVATAVDNAQYERTQLNDANSQLMVRCEL